MKKVLMGGGLIVLGLLCGTLAVGTEPRTVTLALDWTPNTNHTGIYVARELGYFAEEGLTVEIVQPSPGISASLTGSGSVTFGVSMQEDVTMARAEGVPVVSIAAVVQHNTSGFAALAETGIRDVRDFEGKRYGGWGQRLEHEMIRTAMEGAGAAFDRVTFVNIGMIDSFTAARRGVADFFWIFYGWEGISGELQGIDFSFLPLREMADVLDYYTPVIITSEAMIADDPETVRGFVRALSRGYAVAIDRLGEAAEILLRQVPELDAALVAASQAWLSPRYTDEGTPWGAQAREVWVRFAEWALANGLITETIDPDRAFTNDFLPEEGEG